MNGGLQASNRVNNGLGMDVGGAIIRFQLSTSVNLLRVINFHLRDLTRRKWEVVGERKRGTALRQMNL